MNEPFSSLIMNVIYGGCYLRSSDGWANNQMGERRLGELFFGRQTIGRQARTVRRQQIGRLGDFFQTVGRNV